MYAPQKSKSRNFSARGRVLHARGEKCRKTLWHKGGTRFAFRARRGIEAKIPACARRSAARADARPCAVVRFLRVRCSRGAPGAALPPGWTSPANQSPNRARFAGPRMAAVGLEPTASIDKRDGHGMHLVLSRWTSSLVHDPHRESCAGVVRAARDEADTVGRVGAMDEAAASLRRLTLNCVWRS